jgi:hypothetical protein
MHLIQTVFVLAVTPISSFQFHHEFFVTASSRKKMKTPKQEKIKKNMKIKEESQDRKHCMGANVQQILLQERKRPCGLEGQFYRKALPLSHSSLVWLLLLRLGKRF